LLAIGTILWNNNNNEEHKKNNNEHNEGFFGEIWNNIMSKIWSIIPCGLPDEGLLDSHGNDTIVLNTLETSPVTFSLLGRD